ncbi:helix-turn-helix domain-containing protein [Streptomyces sp. NPDC054765]
MDTGSVSAAAERLHLSVPATSRALGRLRRARMSFRSRCRACRSTNGGTLAWTVTTRHSGSGAMPRQLSKGSRPVVRCSGSTSDGTARAPTRSGSPAWASPEPPWPTGWSGTAFV